MRVLMIGPPRFADAQRELMRPHGFDLTPVDAAAWGRLSLFRRGRALRMHDLAHFYWARRARPEEVWFGRLCGTAVIFSFIGSDVLRLQAMPPWKRLRTCLALRGAQAVTAEAPWLADELHAMGLAAPYVPFAWAPSVDPLPPWPRPLRVLTYLPEGREAFYGWPTVAAVAAACPDCGFDIVGHTGRGLAAGSNIVFHGTVETLAGLLRTAGLMLRLTRHDGLSRSVLEALAAGRHVIWTQPYPGCAPWCGVDAAVHTIRQLQRDGALNTTAALAVGRDFSRQRAVERCATLYRAAVSARGRA